MVEGEIANKQMYGLLLCLLHLFPSKEKALLVYQECNQEAERKPSSSFTTTAK
jgi:hypothetical protein